MKKRRLGAVGAERLFGFIILLLLVGLVIDFIFVTNFLKSESSKSEVLHQQADASDSKIAKLKSTATWLNQNQDIIQRTSAIVAQSKLYHYQNQIIEDFYGYAGKTGVGISGFTFTPPPTTPGATVAPVPAATTPAATGAVGLPKTPTGVNSITVAITFTQVSYKNFLNFLRLLEQNITRMQITNITLSPNPNDLQSLVSPTVTIMVYTR